MQSRVRAFSGLTLVLTILFVLRVLQPDPSYLEQQQNPSLQQTSQLLPPNTKATCQTLSFTPRSEEETAQATDLWLRTVQYVQQHKLTYLEHRTLKMHADYVAEIETKGVTGIILETGVAKAGSSLTFAAVKHPHRCLHLFDTFKGMPPPSRKDGKDVHERYKAIQSGRAGKDYYGYMKNLLQFDYNSFVEADLDPVVNSVFFHKGLFHYTVWPGAPVAYAHLDGDWYKSTYETLERIIPWLSANGGILTLDDVQHYSGAKRAFEDYFRVSTEWLLQNYEGKPAGCLVFTRDSKRYALFKTERFGVRVAVKEQTLSDCETIM